jgi:hypothetical protein
MTESQEARLLNELEELAAKLAEEGRAEDGDIVHDAFKLLSEQDELRGLLDDVRILIRDHYSGLPEHREPVERAVTRLDHRLNDEDGEPLDHIAPLDSAFAKAPPVEAATDEGER